MHIAVVGGGPGGLAAAALCARVGIKATLFESRPDVCHEPGAVFLHADGLRVLQTLGCLGDVVQGLQPVISLQVALLGGGNLVDVSLDPEVNPELLPRMVPRERLYNRLAAELKSQGVEAHFKVLVDGLWQDETGAYLSTSSGSHGPFDAILACDGYNSLIREQAGFVGGKTAVSAAYLRGLMPSISQDIGLRDVWGPNRTRFAICPMGNGQSAFLCSVPFGGWSHILKHSLSEWIESWSAFDDRIVPRLSAVDDWSQVLCSQVQEINLGKWFAGPVYVLGDAAHATVPSIAQGVNAALVDALVLVQLLSKREQLGATFEDIGQTYENVRRPHVADIQTLSRQLGSLANIKSQPGRLLRDALLPLAERVVGLEERIARLTTTCHPLEEDYFNAEAWIKSP